MGAYGDLYAEGRERFIALVEALDDAGAATTVPTCPDWTVKDVVAHVTGICADILEGRMDGVATDAWTEAQVGARRDRSLTEIVAEWRTTGPQIDAIIDAFGPPGAQLLADLTVHEHDVRHALGAPGGRDAAVMPVALEFTVNRFLDAMLRENGAGPIEIRSAGQTFVVGGDGEPRATLTAEPFTLLRALTGRRSRAQVTALDWSTDPAPFVPSFQGGPFTFAPADVDE